MHSILQQLRTDDFICGRAFAGLCDTVFPLICSDKRFLFCKTDYLRQCFCRLVSRRNCNFVLVVHDSDYPVDSAAMSGCPFNVRRVYALNAACSHSKLQGIPLGLTNFPHISGSRIGDPAVLAEVINKVKAGFHSRRLVVTGGWSMLTNKLARHSAYTISKKWPEVTVLPCGDTPDRHVIERRTWLEQLASHYYVVSPPGNGVDCCRHWEAMYVGTIPIVLRSKTLSFFSDLPMLQVNSYADVTIELLRSSLPEMHRRFAEAGHKLYMSYWKKMIRG